MLSCSKAICGLAATILAAMAAICQSRSIPGYVDNLPRNHRVIDYDTRHVNDAVSRLGANTKSWNARAGSATSRLASVLQLFGIDPDSQVLVFSKTSFQSELISPRNPRAIYFNDELQVGYVRGSPILEVAAFDRAGGNQFYTLDLQATAPVFRRQTTCLRCHQGVATQGVPGLLVGSVYPAANGHAAKIGAIITDHRTAFGERWGGWYVDAAMGLPASRANVTAQNPVADTVLNLNVGLNDRRGYLSNTSDIVALMTLEHQSQATNLISRLSWVSKLADAPGAPTNAHHDEDAAVEDLLRFLLFDDEMPLNSPIKGVSDFTQRFAEMGPHDRQGRSLRDFDLQTRLFRYPLSYMIYSPSFEALPKRAKDKISRRLRDVLTGADQAEGARNLPEKLRRDLVKIVEDTQPELLSVSQIP
jgi:hypothetical protein